MVLKSKIKPIKGGYTAIKNSKGKVITYVRPTKYGFSYEQKNEKGNWIVNRIEKQVEVQFYVNVVKEALKLRRHYKRNNISWSNNINKTYASRKMKISI